VPLLKEKKKKIRSEGRAPSGPPGGPFACRKAMSSTLPPRFPPGSDQGLNIRLVGCATSLIAIRQCDVDDSRSEAGPIFAGGCARARLDIGRYCRLMVAMSSKYNQTPGMLARRRRRPRRFVIAGRSGVAGGSKSSNTPSGGARIYASDRLRGDLDGHDMVGPVGRGIVRCSHAPQGREPPVRLHQSACDLTRSLPQRIEAIREVFGYIDPPISVDHFAAGHARRRRRPGGDLAL